MQPRIPSQQCSLQSITVTLPLLGLPYLDGELPLGEVRLALLGLLQNPRGVLGGQAAADRTGLLGPEVEGKVLLVLVEEAELSTLLGVDDGKDAGDRLADVVAVGAKGKRMLANIVAQRFRPSFPTLNPPPSTL